jgi:hypothetical protein
VKNPALGRSLRAATSRGKIEFWLAGKYQLPRTRFNTYTMTTRAIKASRTRNQIGMLSMILRLLADQGARYPTSWQAAS